MLTSDLVRFKKSAGRVTPRYLGAKTKDRVLPIAAELVATYRASVGRTLGELDEAAAAVIHEARDRLVVLGLRKLCDDRLLADRPEGLDPAATRAEVFVRAARAHREATSTPFDRSRILAEVATTLGASPDDVDAALFSDLRAAQVVQAFDAITPADLLAGYDLALAQAALFRASRVVISFEGAAPAEVRAIFRAARFHGLLFAIARHQDRFEIVVDGPFSLFGSAQKYGFRLAMFLPTVLSLPCFELRADLRLGAAKEAAEMVIKHTDDVACRRASTEVARVEIERLVAAFRALDSSWEVALCDELLPLPGQAVIVPDLAFTSQKSGEVVYLEMMGFWSRDAVWKRIEQIERGLDARLIVAIKKSLRVSREALDEKTGSSLLVFGTAPSAKEVLALLDAGVKQ